MGENNGEVAKEERGLLDRPLLLVLLVLLSESLLALLIQLLIVGESDNLSKELAELRFFLLDLASASIATSSAWVEATAAAAPDRVSRRVDEEDRVEDLFAEEDRVLRELLVAAAVEVEGGGEDEAAAGLTPFSSR